VTASPRTLTRRFYLRPTLLVARDLLGKVLVHRRGPTVTSGIIVEVEAYIGESDPACHAAPGPTKRNRPLYGPPGFAYVYLNYGMHYLVNVVTEAEGEPAAVLIRALEPLEGIEAMRRRRGLPDAPVDRLCRGPGNLTRAMGLSLVHNEVDFVGARLSIEDRGLAVGRIGWSQRVGISVGREHRWRAYIAGNTSVSGHRDSQGSRGSRAPAKPRAALAAEGRALDRR
jgi:DNA-3-methyladenine glycosylase